MLEMQDKKREIKFKKKREEVLSLNTEKPIFKNK